jgi:hypothetical protein
MRADTPQGHDDRAAAHPSFANGAMLGWEFMEALSAFLRMMRVTEAPGE